MLRHSLVLRFSVFSRVATTAAMSTTPSSKVNLLDLAAACVACTESASKAIHTIVNGKNTRTKKDGSFVTDADFAAQGIIVQAIEHIHPAIDILGEESAEEMRQHMGQYVEAFNERVYETTRNEIRLRYHKRTTSTTFMPLSPQFVDTPETQELLQLLPPDPEPVEVDRIRIIVDPLDGTKSYATGEYEAVSILIAILVDSKPHFGVIGKPFGYGDFESLPDTPCVTFYGGPLLEGVFVGGGRTIQPSKPAAAPRAVISSSRSKGVVHEFCVHLGDQGLVHPEPLLISGAGEKSLRCLLQRNQEALWFYPKGGTSLWDVAAPDALFRVLNGKLTDKYGEELDYSRSRDDAENTMGVVACIDSELHTKCIALFQEGDWLNRI